MHNHTSFVIVMHIYIIMFLSLGNNDSFINIFQFTVYTKKGDNKFIGKHISSKSRIASYAVQYISVARLIHVSSCSCNVETIRCIK